VDADPKRLQQVVWNLLANALKFTPAGGRVNVHTVYGDEWVEVSVSDTGVGIAAEFLELVFERFRQRNGSERPEGAGLGLGLAIVRDVVELHGGTISAESGGEGRGATFRVRLPVAAACRNPVHGSARLA
jgi:signal transduction histidine kinase